MIIISDWKNYGLLDSCNNYYRNINNTKIGFVVNSDLFLREIYKAKWKIDIIGVCEIAVLIHNSYIQSYGKDWFDYKFLDQAKSNLDSKIEKITNLKLFF